MFAVNAVIIDDNEPLRLLPGDNKLCYVYVSRPLCMYDAVAAAAAMRVVTACQDFVL